MWAMSDRAIPRSFRMMEGFGVHTFRLVNKNNESHFVKFHWKPKLGTHAVVWDEAQKISGKNSDFHKQDLWEAIENGNFPEWELGVQLIPEADEHKYKFDLLDPTKLVPEELVPVTIIGRMVLNRNPDNFFAETEQAAFHPGHVVPGIDFTNDPLLQGRLFSYTDTQLSRLGSPNFHEIPINRTVTPMHNNQRDGHMRQEIAAGRVSYHPNSLGGGCPFQAKIEEGGFVSFNERIDAQKVRERSESFSDHFSQAALFFNSQTAVEQGHIIRALRFELGKVETEAIRSRMLGLLAQVNKTLASKVAEGLGMEIPKTEKPINHGVGADAGLKNESKTGQQQDVEKSDALSMLKNKLNSNTITTRQVAFLCSNGVSNASVTNMKGALERAGATVKIIAPHLGTINTDEGTVLRVDQSYLIAASVLFDAVFVPAGTGVPGLKENKDVVEFLNEAFKHCKFIVAEGEGNEVLSVTNAAKNGKAADNGVLLSKSIDKKLATSFIEAMGNHRYWEREEKI
jgi:catalase